jgi:hypothetical protein
MSVSTEVQRTLVKSPPELWAELSSPEALARHLGDFGEIKITSVEPETKVEWEAEGATGVVHLKQSGWGTKVTLTVTRKPPVSDEPSAAEPIAEVEPEPCAETEPTAAELEPAFEPVAERVVEPEPETPTAIEPCASVGSEPDATTELNAATEPEPNVEEPEKVSEPEQPLGFFARLFRKRRAKPTLAVVEPDLVVVVEPEIEIEVVAMAAPEPIFPEPPTEPAADLAAELASVEAQMTEETTELLTSVLDRLGAAHHRPFSRG